MWCKQQTQVQRDSLPGKHFHTDQRKQQVAISFPSLHLELYNGVAQVPTPISGGCSIQERSDGYRGSKERSPDERCHGLVWRRPRGMSGKGWPGRRSGLGEVEGGKALIQTQAASVWSSVIFPSGLPLWDLLKVGLLACCCICHAVFTLSKIGSSCHWSSSLIVKGKKNHAKSFRR